MRNLLKGFLKDEQGVSAVEYAILGSLIAAALVGAVGTLSGKFSTVFTSISNNL